MTVRRFHDPAPTRSATKPPAWFFDRPRGIEVRCHGWKLTAIGRILASTNPSHRLLIINPRSS